MTIGKQAPIGPSPLANSSGWSIKRFARWVLLTLAVRLFLQFLSKFPGSQSQSSFESREHSIHGLLADRCEGNRYVEVNGRYFCQLCSAHLKLCPKHGVRVALEVANVLNLESLGPESIVV